MKDRRMTDCVPGSEKYVKLRNNKTLLKCRCNSCGITKTKFVKAGHKVKVKGLILGKNSPFNGIPLLGAIF